MDVTTDWERAYPYGNTLGELSAVRTGLPEEKVEYYTAKGYNLNDRVGYSYLEESLESVLQGIKSKVKTVTNKQGEVVETEVVSEGVSGNDVVLTIDMELQKAIEKALEEEILNGVRFPRTDHFNKAFVVAMNPKTGEVLALAGKQYDRESKTFFDYGHGTFTAAFEPGSIVKGATILLGYNKGVISPGTVLRDEVMHLPGQKTLKSHVNMGNINDLKALERSSNVYMAKIVLAIGGETYQPNTPIGIDYLDLVKEMRNFYAQFGLGTKTGFVFQMKPLGSNEHPKILENYYTFHSGNLIRIHPCKWLNM